MKSGVGRLFKFITVKDRIIVYAKVKVNIL